MTEPFRVHGTLEFKTAKKARAALEAYRGRCWDFAVDAFRIDDRVLTADFESEVPSDGFETFDKEFVAIAKGAAAGALSLDCYPEVRVTDTSVLGSIEPKNGTRQRIYPKERSVVCARTEPHPPAKISRHEVAIAVLRHPKYAKRFYSLGALVSGTITDSCERYGAGALDLGGKLLEEGDVAYGIVLFDAESRELDRLFPGKKLTLDLAFSPTGTRLAAAVCSGKKKLPKVIKKPRAGESVLVWDLDNRGTKPTKLTVEQPIARPRSQKMAKLLGASAKTLTWTDETTLQAERADGKGMLTWDV